jgi:hypothetical protein
MESIMSYSQFVEKVLKIKEIFEDFFGEEMVDLKNLVSESQYNEHLIVTRPYILVHFPEVKVTNENNRSIDLKDLFARIELQYDGTLYGSFKLNKATYDVAQWKSHYIHSHVPSLYYDRVAEFKDPCLGDGPIKSTILRLHGEYNEDDWKLFCLELQKYVQTESLSGGPYIKLENVGKISETKYDAYEYNPYVECNKEFLNLFLINLLEKRIIPYTFDSNHFTIAMSFDRFAVVVSNAFIEWYNKVKSNHYYNTQELFDSSILIRGIYKDFAIYTTAIAEPVRYDDTVICNFKGRDVKLRVINKPGVEGNVFLNPNIINWIATRILNVLNYFYGRTDENYKETRFI